MKPLTEDHLATAESNRDLADAMAKGVANALIGEQWAVVVAFYAAVHWVNAYLWETQSVQPTDHAMRRRAVSRDPQLQSLGYRYRRLSTYVYNVRYTPQFRLSASAIRRSLLTMHEIEAAIGDLL